MKKHFFLLAVLLALFGSLQAAKFTVSNNPNTPAQYTTVQAACDAASVGDTIYICASPTVYEGFYINKRLVILGEGINQFGYKSTIGAFTWDIAIRFDTISYQSGASGTEISGLYIDRTCQTAYSSMKNLKIHNCFFYGGAVLTNVSNLLIYNCVFKNQQDNYLSLSGCNSVGLFNNIFGSNFPIQYATGVVCSNNIFFSTTPFIGTTSMIITNNIFINANLSTGITASTISNNLGYIMGSAFINGNNIGANNVINDPKFILWTTSGSYNDKDNYGLQSISSGKNLGTDGTDVGIYGGGYPFPNTPFPLTRNIPLPNTPFIRNFQVNNPLIPQNGTLNVKIEAIKGATTY